MKAYDYEAVAYDGAVYCTGCLPDEVSIDDTDYVQPIFASSEWDYYPCCDKCGEVHDYVGLTDEGRKHELCTPWYGEHVGELYIPKGAVDDCSHPGACDNDVWYYRKDAMWTSTCTRDNMIEELASTGGWTREDLANMDDHELQERVLWIAACSIKEQSKQQEG